MLRLIDTQETLIAGPTMTPIDLDETKKALKFTPTTEDTLIDAWIHAAVQMFETETGRAIMAQTRELAMDMLPHAYVIELPSPPLLEIVSFLYDDGDGAEQTLDVDAYRVHAPAGPHAARGRLELAYGSVWPTIYTHSRAVRIRYRCGYGEAPGDVPDIVKAALYMLVQHFHRRGDAQEGPASKLPVALEMMLRGFRQSAIPTVSPKAYTWL